MGTSIYGQLVRSKGDSLDLCLASEVGWVQPCGTEPSTGVSPGRWCQS